MGKSSMNGGFSSKPCLISVGKNIRHHCPGISVLSSLILTSRAEPMEDQPWCGWIHWELSLTGAFYVGNGWVAGGCWDDY